MLRIIKVKHYVRFMSALGFEPAAVLAGSGIDPGELDRADSLISIQQYLAVVVNIVELAAAPEIGLRVGSAADMLQFGIVGHGLMSAPTARDALNLWTRHSNTLVGQLVSVRLRNVTDDTWHLEFKQHPAAAVVGRFCLDEMIAIALRIGSQISRRTLKPHSLQLAYPAPADAEAYRELIGAEVQFGQGSNRLVLKNLDIDRPLAAGDRELFGMCERYCDYLAGDLAANCLWTMRVKSHLSAHSPHLKCFSKLSDELGIGARTLRRRLAAEGTSYQRILADLRSALAVNYLIYANLSVKETGFRLGFRDTNAFCRAFLSWTGQTVSEFREEKNRELRLHQVPGDIPPQIVYPARQRDLLRKGHTHANPRN